MKLATKLCAAGLLATSAQAGPVTESFEDGLQDWQWSHFANATGSGSAGAAEVTFRPTGLPVPAHSTLLTLSGPFLGDYDAAGIQLIGFRFMAASMPANETPFTVDLIIEGNGFIFSRSFEPADAGTWYTFSADVTSAEKGGWVNVAGGMNDFASLRQNVSAVKIRLMGSSPDQANQYFVDDVYLDYLPSVAVQDSPEGAIMEVNAARENQSYRLQVSDNLLAPGGGWRDEPGAISATGRVMRMQLPASAFDDNQPTKYYRLVLE